MSEEKTVTEREAVLRERQAWASGYYMAAPKYSTTYRNCDAEAALRYPLPVRRRPIRVTLSDGRLCYMYDTGAFSIDGILYQISGVGKLCRTADDFRAVARMVDGEMEDAPEDE